MFLTGHDFEIFVGVQKQMWWYHTGLDATHPFTSKWYTWPFLVRPIWLYTNSFVNGKVANIYAMGNPFVFWFGFASVLVSAYWAVVKRNLKLGLVVFSYAIFFVPWAAAPRIMFLYHYLPSVPFLAIATGYVLRKNTSWIMPVLGILLITYIYFYPHWTGIPVGKTWDMSFYWFKSWR